MRGTDTGHKCDPFSMYAFANKPTIRKITFWETLLFQDIIAPILAISILGAIIWFLLRFA